MCCTRLRRGESIQPHHQEFSSVQDTKISRETVQWSPQEQDKTDATEIEVEQVAAPDISKSLMTLQELNAVPLDTTVDTDAQTSGVLLLDVASTTIAPDEVETTESTTTTTTTVTTTTKPPKKTQPGAKSESEKAALRGVPR
uniref:Uncharacterized protein n=1 Tax=Romanomermis culicivorax TaxID=13658 RepID=A0A915K0U8_ROMCU